MQRLIYRILADLARVAVRTGRSKDLEILALRHQITVLRRQTKRPALTDNDRTFLAAIAQALPRAVQLGWIITPETLLRWHRRRIARHWTHSWRRPGRPRTGSEIRKLAVRMAKDNPTWGYRRIHGELTRFGYKIGATTIWEILHLAGIDPAPTRTGVTWTAFLRSQAAVACDFVTIDTALLKRYYLLFFISVPTREVFLAGITTNPTGAWTTQAARSLFLRHADRLIGCKALVRDRASLFIKSFDEVFRTEGVTVMKAPVRTPVANTYAERWIGTLRRELLDRTIVWNQRQLENLVADFVAHYNEHRPHRSLAQLPPRPPEAPPPAPPTGVVHVLKHTRCGGLVNEYRHAA